MLTPGDILWNGRAIGRQNHARIDHVYITKVVEDYAGPEHGTEYCETGADTDNYCNALDVTGVERFENPLTDTVEEFKSYGEGLRGTEDYAIGAALFWAIVGGQRHQNLYGPFYVYEVEPLGQVERDTDYPELGPEIQRTACPVRVVRRISDEDIDRILPHVTAGHRWERNSKSVVEEKTSHQEQDPLSPEEVSSLLDELLG